MDIIYKKISKNSMFDQRRNAKGEIYICQSVKDIKSFQKLKGFQPGQKEAMMGVELLVALQNIKQTYEDKGIPTEPSKDGKNNIYPQIYTTTTHGANIEMVEALAELGYLQMQRKDIKKKNSLISEKLGFGQYKEAGQALLALFSKDDTHKRQMYNIAVSITDKTLDFEQIYKMYKDMEVKKEKNQQFYALKKIVRIFWGLRSKNIDVVTNEIGETIIDYNAQESFLKRMKREQKNSCAEYRKSRFIGDTIGQEPVVKILEKSRGETERQTTTDNEQQL